MIVKNIEQIDTSDFSVLAIHTTEDGTKEFTVVTIQEGSGDNLTSEDINDGLIDYMNFAIYKVNNGKFSEYDGGMIMYRQNYDDIDTNNLICDAVSDAFLNADMDTITAICLPIEANTEFFESIAAEDDIPSDEDLLSVYNDVMEIIQNNT